MARRGIPWGPKNPLWRWQHGKRKVNKSRKRHMSPVVHMPKRRYRRRAAPRRNYRRRVGGWIRRRRPKRFSILQGVGLVAGVTTTLNDRWSILQSTQNLMATGFSPQGFNNWTGDMTTQLIGYDFRDKKWRLPTFTTMVVATALASKLVGKFVKPHYFDSVPVIGKKIKL